MAARFDWYQATVRGVSPSVLQGALEGLAGHRGAWGEVRSGRHGFACARSLEDMEGTVCQVWWGGQHAHPHVVLSGGHAQPGSEILRARFEDHAVSRADACIDYAEPGAYDRLQGIAVGVAKDRGIKVGTAGDHLVTLQGRTLYLGATSSHTRLRLYDKAAELRHQFANDPARLAELPGELARLECQVRPQTPEAKRLASVVDPVTLMGSAAWMRELMRQVAGLELHPFEAGKVWRRSDDERAYAAVLAQYGGLLARIREDLGSWECVGRQIGDDLARRESAKRKRR